MFFERIEEAIAEGNDTLETTGGNIEDELLAEVEEPEPVLAEQNEEKEEPVKTRQEAFGKFGVFRNPKKQ